MQKSRILNTLQVRFPKILSWFEWKFYFEFWPNVLTKVPKNDEIPEKIEILKIDQDHSRLIPRASPRVRNEFSVILDWSGSVWDDAGKSGISTFFVK